MPVGLRKRERIQLEVCSFQEKLRWNGKLSAKSNPLKLTEYFVKHKEVQLRDKMPKYTPESKRA